VAKVLRVDDVHLAIRYAEQCRREGEFDWFRGQTQRWPLVPSLARRAPAEQDLVDQRLHRFWSWCDATLGVAEMLPTDASRMAVAQHYGIPTSLIDFSTEPRLAGFFASHVEGPPPDESAESCIYCFNSTRAREAIDQLARKALDDGFPPDEIVLPALIQIDVDNLWRLQAQLGVFLYVPWSAAFLAEGALEHLLDLTCLVFPYTGPVANPPVAMVYPERKSALEVLLDEFFARDGLRDLHEHLRTEGVTVFDTEAAATWFRENIDQATVGFRPELVAVLELDRSGRGNDVFVDGTPPAVHLSWTETDLASWTMPRVERFRDVVGDEHCTFVVGRSDNPERLDEGCIERMHEILTSGKLSRDRAVRWRVVHRNGREIRLGGRDDDDERTPRSNVGEWIDLAWDGLRSLPYSDDELAMAIGRSVASLAWRAMAPRAADDLFDVLMPRKFALDLVTDTGGDPVAIVDESSLRATLRPDLREHLAEGWRHLGDEPAFLFIAAGNPAWLFDFDRWRRLFVSQIVPTQLHRAAYQDTDWVIYNPTLVRRVRQH
jgi:hypothetical protein